MQSVRNEMKSKVIKRAKDLTDKFCEHQKIYFEMYIGAKDTSKMRRNFYQRQSGDNTFNGCVKCLLDFLKGKHNKYVEFNAEHGLEGSTGLFTYLKENIFQTEQEVIQEY